MPKKCKLIVKVGQRLRAVCLTSNLSSDLKECKICEVRIQD